MDTACTTVYTYIPCPSWASADVLGLETSPVPLALQQERAAMRHPAALRTVITVTSALILVSACNRGSDTDSAAGGKPVVGVDYPRSDTDFWNSFIKYTPQFGDQLGLTLKTTNSQNEVAKLAANVQTFMSQGVKGIVMAPQDTAAIAPALDQLAAKKIPVVTVDTRPDSGSVAMVVRADNRAYGTKACQFLGAKLAG